jgi:TetR/AcrR family transcriptional regulator of autoinduction and epiphytic fitness
MSEERQKQKRSAILAGATEVFRLEGFETASMDRIAEVSGVSKRTIYNHFGSKDALFEAVVEALVGLVVSRKQIEWDPAQSLEAQLRAFARAKTSIVEDEQWLSLVKVVLGIAIQQPERAKEIMMKAVNGEAALVRWLRDAERAGALRVPDPETSSKVFWGMVAGTLFWPQIFEEPQSRETREKLMNEVIATFLARYQVSV